MPSFVHLHVHSHYSILDGMAAIPALVDKAVKSGMPAIALTDHGNMFGIKEFYDYVQKKNKSLKEAGQAPFKAILGCEVYVARRNRLQKDKNLKEDKGGQHLILLAKNKKGYQNLCKLVSISWIEGFYYKPRIDKEMLEKYSEGLIVTSACLGGEISQKLLGNAKDVDDDETAVETNFDDVIVVPETYINVAEESIHWFKRIFGDDYYLEIQRHRTDKPNADTKVYRYQQSLNKAIIDLARRTNTKIVATNDVHFVEEEHGEAHDRLICLSTGKDFDDQKRMRYTKQEWLKTPEEMHQIFSDIPEVFANVVEIADKVENYSIDSDAIMPNYEISAGFGTLEGYKQKFSEEDLKKEFGERFDNLAKNGLDNLYRIKLEADYLEKLTMEGAKERYGDDINDELAERIRFELDTMKTMGYPGYFLIVQDFINAGRKNGISFGPGRGSAAGSVVAYCLKITDIDPLKYDLLFERFLNPDRISMPDIDIDIEADGRGKVLQWVTEKYGSEKVARIVTYGTMATKSSIKDVARVHKLPLPEAERLVKMIPDRLEDNGKALKINIKNCIEKVPELKAARFSSDETLSSTLKYAEMLEGTVRQTGVHACGVIIGADDLSNFVPLSTADDKETKEKVTVTQYEGGVIENVGLIKMDFLGLETLDIIKGTLKNIKKSKNIDIDIDKISLEDEKTYELFSKAQTVGVFQFESAGMQKYLRELKPSKLDDLIAMNALYRPGPMQYIPSFINRKHGHEKISYDLPVMENRLIDTYGITVYQEQVMLLSRDLAGFSRGESDTLRKAMGKKDRKTLDKMKPKFIEGGVKNEHKQQVLEKIWGDWEKFAEYAFNKSHSTCYAMLAYQTGYLKANYPSEFMAAILTRSLNDIKEVSKLMDECRSMGIMVMGADINESDLTFTVNKDGHIRFGLGGVKGVGGVAVEQIVKERDENGAFKGIFDFIERINLNSCNKKVIESLALSGAFDNFPELRREDFFNVNAKGEQFVEILIRYGNTFQADKNTQSLSLFGDSSDLAITKPEIPKSPQWSNLERLSKEKEYIGIYLSAHPLDNYKFEMQHVCNTQLADLRDNFDDFRDKGEIRVGGIVTAIRNGRTKTDKPYGVFTIEDYSGSREFAIFNDDYLNFGKYMQKDIYIMVIGKVQERGADWKFRPAADPNMPKVYEFKINQILMLSDVKEKMIKKISINIDIDKIDDSFCNDFLNASRQNTGNVLLNLNILDQSTILNLFARDRRIAITKEMVDYFDKNERGEVFEVKVA